MGIGNFTLQLIGVALALYQRDVKRVLAYSSIENMGLMALGAAIGSRLAIAAVAPGDVVDVLPPTSLSVLMETLLESGSDFVTGSIVTVDEIERSRCSEPYMSSASARSADLDRFCVQLTV